MRIRQTAAYLAILLAIIAQMMFLVLWMGDSRNRLAVRAAAFLWPAIMLFLAEAMRMSGRAGARESRLRFARRIQIAVERDEPESVIDRRLDEADLLLAPTFLCLLPVAAVGVAVYLWAT
ncbi:MAG TPA: hypothetical protein VM452_06885 [Caulifigura sp.]|jgi:hypothetical protein|nr:hypothetical protein [Caulifigura sp.]